MFAVRGFQIPFKIALNKRENNTKAVQYCEKVFSYRSFLSILLPSNQIFFQFLKWSWAIVLQPFRVFLWILAVVFIPLLLADHFQRNCSFTFVCLLGNNWPMNHSRTEKKERNLDKWMTKEKLACLKNYLQQVNCMWQSIKQERLSTHDTGQVCCPVSASSEMVSVEKLHKLQKKWSEKQWEQVWWTFNWNCNQYLWRSGERWVSQFVYSL